MTYERFNFYHKTLIINNLCNTAKNITNHNPTIFHTFLFLKKEKGFIKRYTLSHANFNKTLVYFMLLKMHVFS